MILTQNYALAVTLCALAMICWGSWQNTRNLIGNQCRFELYYWDYSVEIVIFALLMAFTFGSFGSQGRSFLTDLGQADPKNLLSSALGGFIWNIGTLLLVASISIAGMSVAFPIGGGIGWTLGILINYLGRPEGNPVLLFTRTGKIVLAILVSMQSYRKLANHQNGIHINRNILDDILGAGKAENTGDDNFETVKLVWASYSSAKSGKIIRLDESGKF